MLETTRLGSTEARKTQTFVPAKRENEEREAPSEADMHIYGVFFPRPVNASVVDRSDAVTCAGNLLKGRISDHGKRFMHF